MRQKLMRSVLAALLGLAVAFGAGVSFGVQAPAQVAGAPGGAGGG
jgi:hypothetical protein